MRGSLQGCLLGRFFCFWLWGSQCSLWGAQSHSYGLLRDVLFASVCCSGVVQQHQARLPTLGMQEGGCGISSMSCFALRSFLTTCRSPQQSHGEMRAFGTRKELQFDLLKLKKPQNRALRMTLPPA